MEEQIKEGARHPGEDKGGFLKTGAFVEDGGGGGPDGRASPCLPPACVLPCGCLEMAAAE